MGKVVSEFERKCLKDKLMRKDLKNMLDFADLMEEPIKIDVAYGPKKGEIFTFSDEAHMQEHTTPRYRKLLKREIDRKKFLESKKLGDDIGPRRATAGMMNDGEYSSLLQRISIEMNVYQLRRINKLEKEGMVTLNNNIRGDLNYSMWLAKRALSTLIKTHQPIETEHVQAVDGVTKFIKSQVFKTNPDSHLEVVSLLMGMEHVLLVKEGNDDYHMMLLDEYCDFGNKEQIGMMLYSFKKSCPDLSEEEWNKSAKEWISANEKENAIKFRKTFESCKVTHLEGSDREYKNILIYKNLFSALKQAFNIHED